MHLSNSGSVWAFHRGRGLCWLITVKGLITVIGTLGIAYYAVNTKFLLKAFDKIR